MRGKTHEKHHAAHMRRARGGGVSEHENIPVVPGNPPVIREAEKHKRGGKVKRKRGGPVEGKHMRHRFDRPGRKRGGRVGADKSPLTEAHYSSENEGPQPKTEEGGLSAFKRGGGVKHHHEHHGDIEHHEEHHHYKRGGKARRARGGHVSEHTAHPGAHHRER